MMIRIVLLPAGTVKGVEITRDNTGSPDLEKKVKDALMKVVFPSSGKGATLVFFLKF
jgi:hypothetical protein